jgi:hypothetical protein
VQASVRRERWAAGMGGVNVALVPATGVTRRGEVCARWESM